MIHPFLDFAKKQSGDVDLGQPHHCAFAQFLTAQGHTNVSVGGITYNVDGGDSLRIPSDICDVLSALMNEKRVRSWDEVARALEAVV